MNTDPQIIELEDGTLGYFYSLAQLEYMAFQRYYKELKDSSFMEKKPTYSVFRS